MTRTGYTLTILLGASLGLAACSDSIEAPPPDNTPPPGSTTGDNGTTFDHENDGVSVWDLLKRLTDQGPPSFTSQMHGCMKMHYATLGNVLRSLGVNLANTATNSAGALYASGGPAMAMANYPARVRESVTISTSQASVSSTPSRPLRPRSSRRCRPWRAVRSPAPARRCSMPPMPASWPASAA